MNYYLIFLKILMTLLNYIPQLYILKLSYDCPNHGYLIKFLEINGKNLISI